MVVNGVVNGGAASPSAVGDIGMSLRDWFAGQALPSIIYEIGKVQKIGRETLPQNAAAHCYRIADAMLAERTKESQ